MAKKESKTREQLKSAAKAVVGAIGARLAESVNQRKEDIIIARQDVDNIIRDWPAIPRRMAEDMMQKYGEPNEACSSALTWYSSSPWKKTMVLREEIPHDFPIPHMDVLKQSIDYAVPVEKVGELAEFNGSLLIDRTAGEVTACCDSEARNFLIINLMNDIVKDKISVKEARKKFADETVAHMMRQTAPYTHKFHFAEPSGATNDPDKTKITEAMLHEASERVREVLNR
jgi:hypothetical protein